MKTAIKKCFSFVTIQLVCCVCGIIWNIFTVNIGGICGWVVALVLTVDLILAERVIKSYQKYILELQNTSNSEE